MTGRLDGFLTWNEVHRDPFEDHCGPFFWRQCEDGTIETAFEACDYHCNTHGNLHGGVLMSFGDFSLFAFARDHLGINSAVTISFSSEFISAGKSGDLVKSRGTVTRVTKRLIFARGEIFNEQNILLTYSGVLMRRLP